MRRGGNDRHRQRPAPSPHPSTLGGGRGEPRGGAETIGDNNVRVGRAATPPPELVRSHVRDPTCSTSAGGNHSSKENDDSESSWSSWDGGCGSGAQSPSSRLSPPSSPLQCDRRRLGGSKGLRLSAAARRSRLRTVDSEGLTGSDLDDDDDDADGEACSGSDGDVPSVSRTLISPQSSDSKSSTIEGDDGDRDHDDHEDGRLASLAGEPQRQRHKPREVDPYADVRERMTLLATRDRLLHSSSDSSGRPQHGGEAEIPFFAAVTTYLGYAVLILVGHIRDLCGRMFRQGRYLSSHRVSGRDDAADYAPLLKSWENFYTRRLYHRIQDCFNRPIASSPGAAIDVLERVSVDGNKTMTVLGPRDDAPADVSEDYVDGRHVSFCPEFDPLRASSGPDEAISEDDNGRVARRCLNLGSYNYLGFADDWHQTCGEAVTSSLSDLPVSCSSSRSEFGTTILHKRVEKIVAEFFRRDDALCYNMGFNTNATTIPALCRKRDLLLSDELNHTSIVNGARSSGASIRTFRHNDASHLEDILREAIVTGQPRTRRPWHKIVVLVEGIYSMEGEYCNLRAILDVCKRYGAYLYLDEAHSVGAMGRTGRGCCEHCGVDPRDVDLLMGTFTKSFGGMGGYIAGNADVIEYLRGRCAGSSYHNSLSPVVCQQIITSFEVIMGRDGTDVGARKLRALRDNSNYFRMRLTDMGLHVLGNYDSPVLPVMLYNPTKIAAFSRECFKRGLAVVVVGFPAVPILMSRARFCVSAGHTREQLDRALGEIDEIADVLKLRYGRSTFG